MIDVHTMVYIYKGPASPAVKNEHIESRDHFVDSCLRRILRQPKWLVRKLRTAAGPFIPIFSLNHVTGRVGFMTSLPWPQKMPRNNWRIQTPTGSLTLIRRLVKYETSLRLLWGYRFCRFFSLSSFHRKSSGGTPAMNCIELEVCRMILWIFHYLE